MKERFTISPAKEAEKTDMETGQPVTEAPVISFEINKALLEEYSCYYFRITQDTLDVLVSGMPKAKQKELNALLLEEPVNIIAVEALFAGWLADSIQLAREVS